jgi:hypothetical protein
MADIATTRAPHTEPTEGADTTILLLASAGLLAIFVATVVLHPPGIDHGPEYVPLLF